MKQRKPKRDKRREDFDVSSYGCVDKDFDDTETYIATLRDEYRGRF